MGVVYYQIDRIRLRGEREVRPPVAEDPELFARAEEIVIRFFFYYREDIGAHSHLHDVELVELDVFLDRGADGCGQVRVDSVVGFAHGVDWYFNRLVVAEDSRTEPDGPTTFVEDRKYQPIAEPVAVSGGPPYHQPRLLHGLER